MNTITSRAYKLFNRGMKWNAFEAVFYQSILTVHQIYLFSVTDRSVYGLIGILFCFLYLLVTFLNLGFDKTLAPFFTDFSSNRAKFKRVFLMQFIMQTLFLTLACASLIFFYKEIAGLFALTFKCSVISWNIWLILSMLVLCEGTKKTLRIFCELSFLNKQIALTETGLIILYVLLVWGSYFFGNPIGLYTVFVPLIIQSFMGIFIFTYLIMFKIYKNIPNSLPGSEAQTENQKEDIMIRIIKNRVSNYLNQIGHMIFSGNFLIPFLSYFFGLAQVSVLKLTNNIAIFLTVILERTFGLTSIALLSRMKNLEISEKQKAVNITTKRLYMILYFMAVFLLINFKMIVYPYLACMKDVNWISVYLFLFAVLFENTFITYEQFFVVEEKVYYLFFVNMITAFVFFSTVYSNNLSLTFLLVLLLAMRLIAFFLMRMISVYKFKIRFPYKIDSKYIVISLLAALLYFLIFKVIKYNC